MVQTAGRKLLSLRIIEDDGNSDGASPIFIDVHPMIMFSQLRRTVADKIEAPSVDLYLQGPHTEKLPIRLEHNDAIAIAFNSGDVVIAERCQRQSDSSGHTPDTTSPFAWNGFVPTLPLASNLPGGMMDNAHVIQLKEWAQDIQKQTKEYEHSIIEAAKQIRECLEERKKNRNEQISAMETQVDDMQKENRRDESVCDKAVRAMERTAREHYASVNRKLKIARTLMESIDAEVAETMPNQISLEPNSMWRYDGDFRVEGEALSVTTPDDSSSFALQRRTSGAEGSVDRNNFGRDAPSSAHPQADVSATVAERQSPGTATVTSQGFAANGSRDEANGMRNDSVGETAAQGMGSPTSSSILSTERSHQLSVGIATCIVAARYCLAKQSFADVDLGPIARLGAQLSERLDVSGEALVNKVWNHEALSDSVTSLQKGPVHKGVVDADDGLRRDFSLAATYMVESGRNTVGVLLIMPYEPVLCLLSSNSWYCFYTDGSDGETEMRGFGSGSSLANYVRSRHAVGALHGSMGLGEYEAHLIVRNPSCASPESFDDTIEAVLAVEERSQALDGSSGRDDNIEASTSESPYFVSSGPFTRASICIVVASVCLLTEKFETIRLSRIVAHGVALDKNQGHSKIVDAWHDAAFSRVTAGLRLSPTFNQLLTDRTGFQQAIQSVLYDEGTNQDMAVLLTTAAGTALCLQISRTWYLLVHDCQTFGVDNLSSWRRFEHIVQLAEELELWCIQSSVRNSGGIEVHTVVASSTGQARPRFS